MNYGISNVMFWTFNLQSYLSIGNWHIFSLSMSTSKILSIASYDTFKMFFHVMGHFPMLWTCEWSSNSTIAPINQSLSSTQVCEWQGVKKFQPFSVVVPTIICRICYYVPLRPYKIWLSMAKTHAWKVIDAWQLVLK